MNSFNNLGIINHLSDFEDLAQDLLARYYKRPYPRQAPAIPGINRFYHGVLHAVSVSYATDLVLALMRKHLSQDQAALLTEYDADPELQKLIRLGALCHDIANQQESDTNEQAHAEVFTREMTKYGFTPEKIQIVADAIINKDKKVPDTIASILIGDADRFEYTRVIDDIRKFRIDYLKLHEYFNKIPDKAQRESATYELARIVQYYFGMSQFLCSTINIHKEIENSESCCKDVLNYMKSYRIWTLLGLESNKNDVVFPTPAIFSQHIEQSIPTLELYNDNELGVASNLALEKYKSVIALAPADEKQEPLKIYDKLDSVYIRRLIKHATKPTPINDEITVVLKNPEVLKKSGLESAEKIREQLPDELKSDNSQVKSEFKFRPASCKVKAVYSYEYDNGNSVGLLLSPDKVQSVYFYKANMFSMNIIEKDFSFERPSRIKRLESHQALVAKIHEMDKRRRGEIEDPNNKYFGLAALDRTETLLNYDETAVLAILITEQKQVMRQGLGIRMQLALAGRLVPFARSRPFAEIEPISEEAVLAAAKLIPQKPEHNLEFTSELPSNISEPIKRELYAMKISSISLMESGPKYQFDFEDVKKIIFKAEAFMRDGVPIMKINNENYLDMGKMYYSAHQNYASSLISKINAHFGRWGWFFENTFGIENIEIKEEISVDKKTKVEKRYWYLIYSVRGGQKEPEIILEKLGYKAALKSGDIKKPNETSEAKEDSAKFSGFFKIRLRSIAELTKAMQKLCDIFKEIETKKINLAEAENFKKLSLCNTHDLLTAFFIESVSQNYSQKRLASFAADVSLGTPMTYHQCESFFSTLSPSYLLSFVRHVLLNNPENYWTDSIEQGLKLLSEEMRNYYFLVVVGNKQFKVAKLLAETSPFTVKLPAGESHFIAYMDTLIREKAWGVVEALIKNPEIKYDKEDYKKLTEFFAYIALANNPAHLSLFDNLSLEQIRDIVFAQYKVLNVELLSHMLQKIVNMNLVLISSDAYLQLPEWLPIFDKLLTQRANDELVLQIMGLGIALAMNDTDTEALLESILKFNNVSSDLLIAASINVAHIEDTTVFFKMLTDVKKYAETNNRKDLLILFMAEMAEDHSDNIVKIDGDKFDVKDFLSSIEDAKLSGEQANFVAKFLIKMLGNSDFNADWLDKMYNNRIIHHDNEDKWDGVISKDINEFMIENFYNAKDYEKSYQYSLKRLANFPKQTADIGYEDNHNFVFYKLVSEYETSRLAIDVFKSQMQDNGFIEEFTESEIAKLRKINYALENGISLREEKNVNSTLEKYDNLIALISGLEENNEDMAELLDIAEAQAELGLKVDLQASVEKIFKILQAQYENFNPIMSIGAADAINKWIEDRTVTLSDAQLATFYFWKGMNVTESVTDDLKKALSYPRDSLSRRLRARALVHIHDVDPVRRQGYIAASEKVDEGSLCLSHYQLSRYSMSLGLLDEAIYDINKAIELGNNEEKKQTYAYKLELILKRSSPLQIITEINRSLATMPEPHYSWYSERAKAYMQLLPKLPDSQKNDAKKIVLGDLEKVNKGLSLSGSTVILKLQMLEDSFELRHGRGAEFMKLTMDLREVKNNFNFRSSIDWFNLLATLKLWELPTFPESYKFVKEVLDFIATLPLTPKEKLDLQYEKGFYIYTMANNISQGPGRQSLFAASKKILDAIPDADKSNFSSLKIILNDIEREIKQEEKTPNKKM